jgi:hypothetical protein
MAAAYCGESRSRRPLVLLPVFRFQECSMLKKYYEVYLYKRDVHEKFSFATCYEAIAFAKQKRGEGYEVTIRFPWGVKKKIR